MVKRSLIALMFLSLLLAACSAARSVAPSFDKSAPNAGGVTSGMPAPSQPEAPREIASNNPFAQGQASGSDQQATRLVIRNANLTIVVTDPFKTLEVITRLASDLQGFVVTSNAYKVALENGGEAPEATITIRVPAEQLDSALQTIKGQVKDPTRDVLSENVSGQDVTKEYTDLRSRLRNLQQAEGQLREIMASATRPEDVLNVFNQLTQVREQIEVIQGQIQYYEEAAAMSAISVQIKAEAAVAPLTIGRWQPGGVARDAIQALINTMKTLANVAIWLVLFVLPVLIVIYIPLRLLWTGLRRLLNRRKPPKAVLPPAAPPAAGLD